jgi:hypothetical protein
LPKPVRWSALRPGIALCTGVLGAAALVLVYGRVGAIHARTIRVYLTTDRAQGVIRGTAVWLDGVKIGAVGWLRFRPPNTDTAQRLLIALDVIEDARPRIRHDTRAQIRPGGSRIGSPVVQLDGGSSQAAPIADGDTLATRPQRELDAAREQLAVAAQSLPVVLDNFNAVRDQMSSHSGTIGAFGGGTDVQQMRILGSRAAHLAGRAERARGTLGLAMDSDLVGRAQRTIARADSLAREAATPRSGLARMRTDTLLVREMRATGDELALIGARVEATTGRGTAPPSGAAALQEQIREADARLRTLMRDVARRPLRYLNF